MTAAGYLVEKEQQMKGNRRKGMDNAFLYLVATLPPAGDQKEMIHVLKVLITFFRK